MTVQSADDVVSGWRDLIGTEREKGSLVVTERMIRSYAYATANTHPLHHDANYCRSLGFPDLVAPVNMLTTVSHDLARVPEEDLRPDGLTDDRFMVPVDSSMIVMGGGQQLRIACRVHPGTVAHVWQRLTAVEEKSSGLGRIALVTTVADFRDEDGALIVGKTETSIIAGLDNAPASPSPSRQKWEGGILEASERPGSAELPPPTSVGDELRPLVKHPTNLLLFRFSAVVGVEHRIHYDQAYARSEGHRDVLVHQTLHAAFLGEIAQSTWGPRSFVGELQWKNRGRAFPGDVLTVSGRITAVDGDRISCALEERNAVGDLCVEGAAVIHVSVKEEQT